MKMIPVLLAVLSISTQLDAQQNHYVRVKCTGVVHAKPEVVKIRALLTSNGETPQEATDKFNEKKQAATDTFDPMEFKEVEIKFGVTALRQNAQNNFGVPMIVAPGAAPAAPVDSGNDYSVTSEVEFVIEIDNEMKMSSLLELVGRIAEGLKKSEMTWTNGYNPGTGQSLMAFELQDQTTLVNQATEKAMENAKTKALHIAKLSNRKLGKVISVTEINSTHVQFNPYPANYFNPQPGIYPIQTGQDMQVNSIPISANLEVTFELLD